jgi:hypothetical protein
MPPARRTTCGTDATLWKVWTMAIDEPVSRATELFVAKQVLDAHWSRALDQPWRAGGCLQCQDRNECPQLDWAVGLMAEVVSVMLQK